MPTARCMGGLRGAQIKYTRSSLYGKVYEKSGCLWRQRTQRGGSACQHDPPPPHESPAYAGVIVITAEVRAPTHRGWHAAPPGRPRGPPRSEGAAAAAATAAAAAAAAGAAASAPRRRRPSPRPALPRRGADRPRGTAHRPLTPPAAPRAASPRARGRPALAAGRAGDCRRRCRRTAATPATRGVAAARRGGHGGANGRSSGGDGGAAIKTPALAQRHHPARHTSPSTAAAGQSVKLAPLLVPPSRGAVAVQPTSPRRPSFPPPYCVACHHARLSAGRRHCPAASVDDVTTPSTAPRRHCSRAHGPRRCRWTGAAATGAAVRLRLARPRAVAPPPP